MAHHHELTQSDRDHLELLWGSFYRVTGQFLGGWKDPSPGLADRLHEATFVVASHGLEPDPILNYGNLTALRLWDATWDEFVSMPSRLTAEPMEREERERLLFEVSRKGFIDHYTGVRISTSGRRFKIEKATVWNVLDDDNQIRGQAVWFSDWRFL